jgi:hypothetical protein
MVKKERRYACVVRRWTDGSSMLIWRGGLDQDGERIASEFSLLAEL